MAAMIEMARALKHGDCRNAHTLIFVALDMEETGTQGATAFVQEFLIKVLLQPMNFPDFQVGIDLQR
jgi:Zn-dependent M28 family amino/carboxypeptidase